ncbi:IucC family-domain-containing protein [Crassisporium funariophilum]|nr:IucC family-domain-containing protein [Crassisporium funariophilum]
MSSGSGLQPREHAAFAVISRLTSCLVTEQILRALYVPFKEQSQGAKGLLVVLSIHTISENPDIFRPLDSDDIFIIIPLHQQPVFKDHSIYGHAQYVGLVDPLDMLPHIYEFRKSEQIDDINEDFVKCILDRFALPPWNLTRRGTLKHTMDPVSLWKRFVEGMLIPENLRDAISVEIQSSLDWQTLAYTLPPSCPSLRSSPIEWEQSLVAGHPTHPMHRARMLSSGSLDYDWYHPRIRFVQVPRSKLDLRGRFEEISHHLATTAAQKAGRTLQNNGNYIYMPVHELQIENVTSKFKDAEVLSQDISVSASAQSSIRTVVVSELPGLALKLAVGVKISSSLRTISHFTADFGPRFSAEVVPQLAVDQTILAVELESSSAIYRSADPEIAKHFTAVIREEYQAMQGEVVIVCAALLEMDHAGVPAGISAVQHVFALDTEKKRAAFLDKYIELACKALLPALIVNGVAFEAHAQNVLIRVDATTGEPRGFVIRDLGGLRIHPPTLRASTGVDFQFLPGHCVATSTLEEIYPKFYHTFVHNHIQRLIRVLGFHYNGRGWEMLRKHMESIIPRDHQLWEIWMGPASTSVNSKCLMRMRMRDSYRDMVYSPYPNMIQYRPHIEAATHNDNGDAYRRPFWPKSLSYLFISMYEIYLKRFSMQ